MDDTHEIVSDDGLVRIRGKFGDSIILGRNPLSKVKDKSVSKEHLKINLGSTVRFFQLGSNPSTVNGVVLRKGQSVTVDATAQLSLYKNDHNFRLSTLSTSTSPIVKAVGTTSTIAAAATTTTTTAHVESREFITGKKRGREESPLLGEGTPTKKKPPASLQSWLKKDDAVSSTDYEWRDFPAEKLMVLTPSGVVGKTQILGFDVDSTVIATKSGKTFGVDYDDWKILFSNCAKKMEEELQKGKKLCFFTNQAGIERGRVDKKKFQKKMESILRVLGLPVQVFVSCGDGYNRKPLPGMWEALEKRFNDSVAVDRGKSLYVGDAAGRPDNWKPKTKKDFSCADRLFAINLDIPFQTPEEFFQSLAPPPFALPDFDPRLLRFQKEIVVSPKSAKIVADEQEIVVFVGSPASGKSTFAHNHLIPRDYVHVNRDSLGSWQKCVQIGKEALVAGKRVVVDNTNGDKLSRQRYVALAKERNIKTRCFFFEISTSMARHMNKYRRFAQPDKAHKDVTDMVIYSYHKNLEEPTVEEGFEEIVKINFVPKFDVGADQELQNLFFSFLLDK